MIGHNLTREQAQERATLLFVQTYTISLDLTGDEKTFHSTTTVTFEARAAEETFLDVLAQDLHSASHNGTPLDTSEAFDGERLWFQTQEGANELTVRGEFPYSQSGEGLHRFVDPADEKVYLYTQFEVPDARRVFAVFEQPDLKASFRFTVTALSDWKVFSNSPVATSRPGPTPDSTVTTFAPTARISSYISAVVAGPYEGKTTTLNTRDGRTVPLGLYCCASLSPYLESEEIFSLTRAGFRFFEDVFDVPFPFEQYNQIFVPEFNFGAMENAGAVTLADSLIFRSKAPQARVQRRDVTVLHELAHMWFGDMVTMRWWNDLWLNESFAEFASTLAAAEATSHSQVWSSFASGLKEWAYQQDQRPTTHPIVAPIRDLEDVQVNFDGITYAKGASVLKQLVTWVGREQFFTAVNRYFTAHAWGNTELSDFLHALEQTSGKDMRDWAHRWLSSAGVNTLRPEVRTDAAGCFTQFTIVQSADPEHPVMRPHRLAIGLYHLQRGPQGTSLVRTRQLMCTIDGPMTEIRELHGLPQPDLILLNDEDLSYATIRLDKKSQETALAHIGALEHSLPRAIILLSFWDATWNGEFPASRYLTLALEAVKAPTDSAVMSMLLRQIVRTTTQYIAPTRRVDTMETVAARLWQLTLDAPAGSDAQLQLVTTFAQLSAAEEHLNILERILDGEQALPGLTLDQDVRWQLLVALSAGGRVGEERIHSESAQDGTHLARLWALTAIAAAPTAAAKQQAWDQLLQGEVTNAEQRAIVAGWGRVHDPALLAPFREPYFAHIRGLWEKHSHEIAENLATGLYPRQLAEPETLQATEEFLVGLGGEHPALQRLILEGADEVRRRLAAHHQGSPGSGSTAENSGDKPRTDTGQG